MKRKTQKIAKDRGRPKLDRADVEALVRELARPERLAREAGTLLRRLRDEPALLAIRFEPRRLVEVALEEARAAAPEATPQALEGRIVDRLVTPELRELAKGILEARARAGGRLDDMLPYRVGVHLLEADVEKGRAPSQNPFWSGVFSASALEAVLLLYLESHPREDLEQLVRTATVASAFEAFLEGDERVKALRRAHPQLDVESILIHAMLGFDEAHEIALPIDAALAGPYEAARAARRRQALHGVGSPAAAEEEQAKTLVASLERDRDRAVAAYRSELRARLGGALRGAEKAVPGAALRAARLVALLVSLEAMPPGRNVPLLVAYEASVPRAFADAEPWEKPLVHAMVGRPLDPSGYRDYARRLAEKDPARGRSLATAALALFPGDEELAGIAGGGPV